MFRRLMFNLPAWAQPEHPILRYMLQRYRNREPRWRRLIRIFLQVLAVAMVVLLGFLLATDFGQREVSTLHAVLYWPLVFLGVLVGLGAMMLTSNAITMEKTRGTWDSLRITSHGANLAFQARWASVFYSLRGPLGVLLAARLVFVVAILIDLTQYYRGRYLDLLLSGITPTVSVPVGAALLAATMTAAIMQPLVAVGLDAAVGLLLSVLVRDPRYDILVRTLLGGTRVSLAVVAIVLGTQAFAQADWMVDLGRWVTLLAGLLVVITVISLLAWLITRRLFTGIARRLVFGLIVLALIVGGLVVISGIKLEEGPWLRSAGSVTAILAQGVAGDQGLRLLTLEESGPLWADVEYGILVGLLLLVVTLFQAWLAGRIVSLSSRLAERAE